MAGLPKQNSVVSGALTSIISPGLILIFFFPPPAGDECLLYDPNEAV